MGGSRARAVTSARQAADQGKEAAQDHTADGAAVTRAGDQAARTMAGNVDVDKTRGLATQLRRKNMAGLAPTARAALIDHFKDDPEALDDLFAATPDSEPETLRRIVATRFHKELKTEDEAVWDAGGLRRLYAVFAALPVAHVVGNDKMDKIEKYTDSDKRYIHGYYQQFTDTAGFSYDPDQLGQGVHGEYVEATDGLLGVNEFDSAARHEVGHAVDAKFGYTDRLMGQSMFGGWQQYNDAMSWVMAMYESSPSPQAGSTDPSHRRVLLEALASSVEKDPSTNANGAVDVNAVSNRFVASVRKTLHDNPHFVGAAVEAAAPIVAHIGRVLTGAKPWNDHDGGGVLGGRVYEESYKGQYMSYDAAARDPARRCSLYQFRAPGEFFAESYSLYYSPVKAGQIRGKLLADRNKPLFDWMHKEFEKPAKPSAPTTPKPKSKP